jgi:hypothetical protein
MTALPTTPEAISADWLKSVLGGATVEGVRVDDVLAGSTTKVFVHVDTADAAALELCIKGVFDEPRLPVRVLAAKQEARFFHELAPQLDMPLFRVWYASADEHQGVVVFDDLRRSGTTFTTAGTAWTEDLVAAALEVQATWHAATWGFPADRHAWLVSGNQILAAATDQLFSEEHWNAHTADPATVEIPERFRDRARIEAAERALFRLQATSVHALSHGDAHIGNTYISPDGQPGFYDWQTFCLAPPLDDASYFIAGALTTEDRREHEQDLLRHYLAALAAHGAPAPKWDEAWRAYRAYQVHGFFWAVLPTEWQPVACSIPMAERYMAAMADHDTLELLEK